MKQILTNIANLIKVKTIVTLVVITVFAVLALKGLIAPDNVMIIISMVVSFYFGTQHEKKEPTTPTVPTAQSPVAVIGAAPDSSVLTEGSGMDAATYSKNHPDSTM